MYEKEIIEAIKNDNLNDMLFWVRKANYKHNFSLPHEVARYGAESIFNSFLKSPGYYDCFSLNKENMAPFDLALQGGHLSIAKTLHATGKVDLRNALYDICQFTGELQKVQGYVASWFLDPLPAHPQIAAELWVWVKQLPPFVSTILNRQINQTAPMLAAAANKKLGVFFITALLTEYPNELDFDVKNPSGDYIPHALIASALDEAQVLPTLQLLTEVMRKRDLLIYFDQWRDKNGNTALMLLAQRGFFEATKFLVDQGRVDITLRNLSGNTAKDIALIEGNTPAVNDVQLDNYRKIVFHLSTAEAAVERPTLIRPKSWVATLHSKVAEHDELLRFAKEEKVAQAIIQKDPFLNLLYEQFTHLFTIALQALMLLFSGVIERKTDKTGELAKAIRSLGTIPLPFIDLAASLAASGINAANDAIVKEKIQTIANAFNANTLSKDIEAVARTFVLFMSENLPKKLQNSKLAKPFAEYVLRCFLNFIEVSEHATWTAEHSFFQRLALALHEHEKNYRDRKCFHSAFLDTLKAEEKKNIRAMLNATPIVSNIHAAYAFYPQVYRGIAGEAFDFAQGSGYTPLLELPAPHLGNPYLNPTLQPMSSSGYAKLSSPPAAALTTSLQQALRPEETSDLLNQYQYEVTTAIENFYQMRSRKCCFFGRISEDESEAIKHLQLELSKTQTPDAFIQLVSDIRGKLKNSSKDLGAALLKIIENFSSALRPDNQSLTFSKT